jgi:hypothetical protein
MQNERIVVGVDGPERTVKPARKIIVPDVRPLAVFLDDTEGKVLLWSHRVAVETLDKIIRRQRWCYVKEVFEIDVPDMEAIARRFPMEEESLVLEFWKTYDALVCHFMPKATGRAYYFDGGVRGGLRYHGLAWYSKHLHE